MNKKIMIYADGGSKVCMGHIMRTMTLALELRKNNIDVIFVTSSKDAVEFVNSNGFQIIKIECLDYRKLVELALEYAVNGIMVDKFGFKNWEHQLLVDNVGFMIQIDDFLYDGPANLVINSTIDEKPKDKENIWLCGGKYALIRNEFSYNDRNYNSKPQNILITTGYGDPGNIHLKMIELIENILPNIKMHIVVGGGYLTKELLYSLARDNPNMILYENLTDLSGLMKKNDIAISAAGTSLYELAAAGMPTIAFSLYDNQVDNIIRVEKKGSILSLGWYEQIDYILAKKYLLNLYNDALLRKKIGTNGLRWIDGNGTKRIVKEIINMI